MAADTAAPTSVLQIISSLNPDFGGPPEGAKQICRSLHALGVRADLATLDSPGTRWGCDCGMIKLGPARLGRYSYSDRLLRWIRDNARAYDGVIVHGLWQYHGLATWRALAGTGVPYYVFPHGMLDPWFKRTYPLKHLKKQLYWPAEYRVLRDARAVLFTTEEERHLARETFDRYDVKEVVIGYGISTPPSDADGAFRAQFLGRFPELRGKRLVLFLGRVHPKKGCDLLIEAFAKFAPLHPDLHLVMAGPDQDDYQPRLVRQAAQLGIDSRIAWTGMLKGDDKWGAYHAAEVFALPSHQENFGISVAEALGCGVPVLISNKVNIWREIVTSESGLVAEDTRPGISGQLEKWLALGPAERERMGRNGLACFADHFHIDATTTKLLDTLTENGCTPRRTFAA